MDNSSNIFSYCVGALALISAIVSVIIYYSSYLPGVQIKVLDDVLRETRGIYETADADGLLPAGMFRQRIVRRLSKLEDVALSLRERAYRATTPLEEYLALARGLSWEIMKRSHDVKKLRAFLLTTSEEERRRRDNHNSRQTSSLESINGVMQSPVPRREIISTPDPAPVEQNSPVRPGSCPPSLDCIISCGSLVPARFQGSATVSNPSISSPSTLLDSENTSVASTMIGVPQTPSFYLPGFLSERWRRLFTTTKTRSGSTDSVV